MARIRVLTVAVIGSLAVASAVAASTIVGGSENDTLRGTPRADKLYGKAGNDRLYGLRGNDVLVGGAGADRLVCGPGRDIAWADAKDRVAKDCEIVKGLEPSSSVTTCGARNLLRIDEPGHAAVLRGRRLASRVGHADDRHNVSCSAGRVRANPPGRPLVRGSDAVTSQSGAIARSLLVRSWLGTGPRSKGSSIGRGRRLAGLSRCSSSKSEMAFATTATRTPSRGARRTPPPAVSAEPGTFCGLTEQSLELCFDVVGTPEDSDESQAPRPSRVHSAGDVRRLVCDPNDLRDP